jgi:hypothetical protein
MLTWQSPRHLPTAEIRGRNGKLTKDVNCWGEIQIRLNQLALAYVSDDEVTELARWIRDVADQVIEPSVSPLDRQLVLDDDI